MKTRNAACFNFLAIVLIGILCCGVALAQAPYFKSSNEPPAADQREYQIENRAVPHNRPNDAQFGWFGDSEFSATGLKRDNNAEYHRSNFPAHGTSNNAEWPVIK